MGKFLRHTTHIVCNSQGKKVGTITKQTTPSNLVTWFGYDNVGILIHKDSVQKRVLEKYNEPVSVIKGR